MKYFAFFTQSLILPPTFPIIASSWKFLLVSGGNSEGQFFLTLWTQTSEGVHYEEQLQLGIESGLQ